MFIHTLEKYIYLTLLLLIFLVVVFYFRQVHIVYRIMIKISHRHITVSIAGRNDINLIR